MAASVARFGSLGCDPPVWLATSGILLHEVGIACFSINGQRHVDISAVGGGLVSLVGSRLAGRHLVRATGPGDPGPLLHQPGDARTAGLEVPTR